MNRDDRVQLMLETMRAGWQPNGEGVAAERAAFEGVAKLFPEPTGVVEEDVRLGGVPAIRTMPAGGLDDNAPTILYLHGGAFLIGSARIYREQSARLSRAAGARVVTLDYRLAPEHPFPAALDDTVAAYLDLLAHGVDAWMVVIAGDSAGGNLALAAAMRLRDGRHPLPAGLALISPWVDLTCAGASMQANANPRHLAQRAGLLASASTYLQGQDAGNPLESPLTGDLSDLPPILIQVGSLETLLDDSLMLERRAAADGTRTRLQIFDGMVHEWHLLSALLPAETSLDEAREAVDEIGRFVRESTAG